MHYQEARVAYLETFAAWNAAWLRSGRKEDSLGKFEHQSIEKLHEELAENGPKLGTPEYHLMENGKGAPDDCIAVLTHDYLEFFVPSKMSMTELQTYLIEEVFSFPPEED